MGDLTTNCFSLSEDMATVEDYLNNAKWVKRIGELFDRVDRNKDGYISQEDWLRFPDELAKVVPDRPAENAKFRELMMEVAREMGFPEGVTLDKQKFIELAAAMMVVQVGKIKRGEQPLTEKVDQASFDVVDRNHDGNITWDEYQLLAKTGHLGEDAAKAAFDFLDRNKNGKIDRKDWAAAGTQFWCYLDSPDTEGMLGAKFE